MHSFLSKPLAKQMSQYTLFSAICKPFEPNIDFFHKPGLGRSFQPYPGIRKKGYLPRGISIIFWLVMFIKTKKAKKKIYKEQKPQRKKKRKEKKRKRKENKKKSINQNRKEQKENRKVKTSSLEQTMSEPCTKLL